MLALLRQAPCLLRRAGRRLSPTEHLQTGLQPKHEVQRYWVPRRNTAETQAPEIPDKLYFRIGEVAKLAGVQPYVLRYWETEFPAIEPKKSGSNHRLYRRKDVETILEIKRLLYDKRYTIEGARKYLGSSRGRSETKSKSATRGTQAPLFDPTDKAIRGIRRELEEILTLLKQ
jgi:DNA-binding transcriptional MerR regulator